MPSRSIIAAFGVLSLAASTAAVLTLPASTAAAQTAERRINAAGFTAVTMQGDMNVVIEHGDRIEVIARGSQAALADLDPVVEKGVLRLKEKKGLVRERLRVKDDIATIFIRMPTLTSFALAGAGNVTLKEVKANDLEMKIAGSGDIDATGTCKTLSLRLAGSGDVNAKDLKCQSVDVKIAGAGDVSTYAAQDFNATIMGAGDINVYGNPKNRNRKVFGAGDINYHK